MPRRRSGPDTASPPSLMVPDVGRSRPPAMRMSVVLPQPEGPRNTTSELRAMSSEVVVTTGTVPKVLVTCSKRR